MGLPKNQPDTYGVIIAANSVITILEDNLVSQKKIIEYGSEVCDCLEDKKLNNCNNMLSIHNILHVTACKHVKIFSYVSKRVKNHITILLLERSLLKTWG